MNKSLIMMMFENSNNDKSTTVRFFMIKTKAMSDYFNSKVNTISDTLISQKIQTKKEEFIQFNTFEVKSINSYNDTSKMTEHIKHSTYNMINDYTRNTDFQTRRIEV